MSYSTQARLAQDTDLLERVAACAATQNIHPPVSWAYDRQWQLSAQPGWDAAYAYAIAANVEFPGAQGTVITDAMILSGVQAIVNAEATPSE